MKSSSDRQLLDAIGHVTGPRLWQRRPKNCYRYLRRPGPGSGLNVRIIHPVNRMGRHPIYQHRQAILPLLHIHRQLQGHAFLGAGGLPSLRQIQADFCTFGAQVR